MFKIEKPNIRNPIEIEKKSLEIIENEADRIDNFKSFAYQEREVLKRLIHTTSCFKEVIENTKFLNSPIDKIENMLQNGAKIIVDTNMIKSGLSKFYTEKYNNEIICHVNESRVFKLAKEQNQTRSYIAIDLAIKENRDKPLILACGNAPTFIYSSIKTLLDEKIDLSNVAFLGFPVGFVNVVESKEYLEKFCDYYSVPSIIMSGRFGSSTMIVSTLHSIYKLMKGKEIEK